MARQPAATPRRHSWRQLRDSWRQLRDVAGSARVVRRTGGGAGGTGGTETGGSSSMWAVPARRGPLGKLLAPRRPTRRRSIHPKEYQTMDGFGFADVSADAKLNSTAALVTLLFDPVNRHRVQFIACIGIDGTSGKPTIMRRRGVRRRPPRSWKHGGKVRAAPWSPPAEDKDNDNVNNGGHLQTADRRPSWASVLAAFPGVLQATKRRRLCTPCRPKNEPDFVVSYQSCIFNLDADECLDQAVLQPKLAALNPPVAVLAAEPGTHSIQWVVDNDMATRFSTTRPSARSSPSLATHDYGQCRLHVDDAPSAPPAGR